MSQVYLTFSSFTYLQRLSSIFMKKIAKVSSVSFSFSIVKHRGNYLAFYRKSRNIFVIFFSFLFSSFTYSARFLYFMKEIEKASLVYFSFSPRWVISIVFHQRYPWRRCRCRGKLFFFTVAARRGSGWIFGKFSFIFIKTTYNDWDSKEFSPLSARSFYLIQ